MNSTHICFLNRLFYFLYSFIWNSPVSHILPTVKLSFHSHLLQKKIYDSLISLKVFLITFIYPLLHDQSVALALEKQAQMSSSSPALKPDVALSLTLSPSPTKPARIEAINKSEERGLRLIQLLLKCANHTSSGNLHRADACLRHISPLASVTGDSMQRLAAQFAYALASRLVKRWPGLYKALTNRSLQLSNHEMDPSWALFSQAFPYLRFVHAIIAQTLVRAMSAERVIHVVDLGTGDPNFWVPLIQSFSLMAQTRGPPRLKITCVNSNKVVLEKLGLRLVKEAEGLDIPFQFNPVNVSLKELTIDMLKVRSGEALAFVSILNLHVLLAEDDRVDAHFGPNKGNKVKDCKQMGQFLAMVRSMSPKLFFLVEQEADHNLDRLVDRFVGGLHYYSAMFDSLDVNCGSLSCEERFAVEEMFGREIVDIVACEGLEREERHERYARWIVRFVGAGFKPAHMWCDAKQIIEAYGKDGYKIMNDKSSLMICWHERPLYAVSAWIS